MGRDLNTGAKIGTSSLGALSAAAASLRLCRCLQRGCQTRATLPCTIAKERRTCPAIPQRSLSEARRIDRRIVRERGTVGHDTWRSNHARLMTVLSSGFVRRTAMMNWLALRSAGQCAKRRPTFVTCLGFGKVFSTPSRRAFVHDRRARDLSRPVPRRTMPHIRSRPIALRILCFFALWTTPQCERSCFCMFAWLMPRKMRPVANWRPTDIMV
mmetsp:Transcript_332/g.971  ORF Transcript_332/g.971 Transcript_332/m.971 type:complete len:213 (-) Transcript_332:73-711(-)